MPLPTRDVVGVLADNLRLRRSVLPIPSRRATRWARELGLPRGGERVIYTGTMYQLVPYIERLVRLEQRFGNTSLARFTGAARRLNRVVNGIPVVARPSRAKSEEYDRVPANVVLLLRNAGVEVGYLYEDDLYTGALAYDLGAEEAVALQARRVAGIFEKYGVQEVITIDPHTTTMLRSVFPKLVEGYNVRVRSYLEVLADLELHVSRPLSGQVVVHDSCVYARYEDLVEAPRQLLAAAGLDVAEPDNSRARTWCCGGPAEALYPEKAAAIAAERVRQLSEVAAQCVTMCPICLVNLRKAADETVVFRDISEYLVESVSGQPGPARPGLPLRRREN
jgi:Fe-S oxidoreductase